MTGQRTSSLRTLRMARSVRTVIILTVDTKAWKKSDAGGHPGSVELSGCSKAALCSVSMCNATTAAHCTVAPNGTESVGQRKASRFRENAAKDTHKIKNCLRAAGWNVLPILKTDIM